MSKSLKRAEEAAYNGENQMFDTQLCTDLQNEILSSSPRMPPDEQSASKAKTSEADIVDENTAFESQGASQVVIRVESIDEEAHNEEIIEQAHNLGFDDEPRPRIIQRGDNGSLRLFSEGKEHRPADFDERHQRELRNLLRKQKMDEFSQLSSLSPTQPNSESCYRPYYQRPPADQLASTREGNSEEDGDEDHASKGPEATKHHSVVTDSTAYTYGENDTGHVNLILTTPENPELDENEKASQDASFAPQGQGRSLPSCEPRTPAAINPFLQKGSVMKGHEMFGATQPSSVGRHISPTSSRPSPDIYNNFSPQKVMSTSPLERRGNDTKLQSSVRAMLRSKSTDSVRRAETSPTSSSRSLSYPKSRREPRDVYVSVEQSQERRQQEVSSDSDPEPEDDFLAGLNPRKLSRRADEKTQRMLAQVTSSRPGSGVSGDVEVPASGGRRRSVQEDYIAQCSGTDARDTQQDEVIIDSQAIGEDREAMDNPEAAASQAETEGILSPRSSPPVPAHQSSMEAHRVPELHPTSQTEEASSPPRDSISPLQQPSLPLQEVSTNQSSLKTPVASKVAQVLSDEGDPSLPNTILETSPLGEGRIRPMGEVTSLSFTDNAYDESAVDGVPGFTQDVEFHNAINTRHSPTPSPKLRMKAFPTFEPLVTAANIPNAACESLASHVSGSKDYPTKAFALAKTKSEEDHGDGEKSVEDPKSQTEGIEESDRVVAEPQNLDSDGLVDAVAPFHDDRAVFILHNIDEDATVNESVSIPRNDEEGGEENNALQVSQEDETIGALESSHIEETPILPKRRPYRRAENVPKPLKEPIAKRDGLRTKAELKGPSSALRRSDETAALASQRSSNAPSVVQTTYSSKRVPDISSNSSTPLSSLGSTPALESTPAPSTRSSTRNNATHSPVNKPTPDSTSKPRKAGTTTHFSKEETPVPAPKSRKSRRSTLQANRFGEETPASLPPTRSSKRKSTLIDEDAVSTRASKRQIITRPTRESSEDPLAYSAAALKSVSKTSLFFGMAFAVSYSKEDQEKSQVTSLILEQGGRLLEDGFEKLFESPSLSRSDAADNDEPADLVLTPTAKSIGFIALISNEHSRKAKYMQALALGLPCISGRWILACVANAEIVDWSPYLLCAGQSSFLGNAFRSRTLAPYSATKAKLPATLSSREKLLKGKSVLLVTAKGKEDSRKAYVFLTRAMGPSRIDQVSDHAQARKRLLNDEVWDLLYVDKNESTAEAAVFGSHATTNSGSKKRKRGPIAVQDDTIRTPKKIRVINDEFIIQSLILGKLLEG